MRRNPGTSLELFGLGSHDDLAAPFEGDAALLAERVQGPGPLDAQPGLERTRHVVDPRMDDAAVVPRLVPRDLALLLEHAYAQARVAPQQLTGDAEPEDARTDNGQVDRGGWLRAAIGGGLHDLARLCYRS